KRGRLEVSDVNVGLHIRPPLEPSSKGLRVSGRQEEETSGAQEPCNSLEHRYRLRKVLDHFDRADDIERFRRRTEIRNLDPGNIRLTYSFRGIALLESVGLDAEVSRIPHETSETAPVVEPANPEQRPAEMLDDLEHRPPFVDTNGTRIGELTFVVDGVIRTAAAVVLLVVERREVRSRVHHEGVMARRAGRQLEGPTTQRRLDRPGEGCRGSADRAVRCIHVEAPREAAVLRRERSMAGAAATYAASARRRRTGIAGCTGRCCTKGLTRSRRANEAVTSR